MFYKTTQEWQLKKMRVKREAKAHLHTREGVPLYNRFQVYHAPLTYCYHRAWEQATWGN